MGRFRDPTGMPPKILSSGRTIFVMARVTAAIDGTILNLFDGVPLIQGQAEVSAIRFSLVSLSDLSSPRESEALRVRDV